MSESRQWREWRTDAFKAMGFTSTEAMRLAETDLDVARSRELQKKGCPLHLIEPILGDDNWKPPRKELEL